MARAKIICTMGPACRELHMVEGLIACGMNVARINFSHGTHDEYRAMISTIREAAGKKREPIAILGDLSGPKIRIGELEKPSFTLSTGSEIVITTREVVGNAGRVSTTYPNLVTDVEKNNRILIDDGNIELRVIDVKPDEVRCTVEIGGELKPHKGMNLPGAVISAPAISAKDLADIEFAVREGIDFLALSFVRTPEDVIKAKKVIANYGSDIPVIAKIEKEEAVRTFDRILNEADGIMIARGDLGVELASEQVPLIQKRIIKACNETAKPVITATQMLESMTQHPRPTRAETSDVANAIIDGSDAVMLSGETAVGRYPLKAAEMMCRIVDGVEREMGEGRSVMDWIPRESTVEDAVTAAACRAAEILNARAIVAYTQSGSTAMRLSQHRPKTRILAISPNERIRRRLTLFWGVRSALVELSCLDTDSMLSTAEKIVKDINYAVPGEIIVITSGTPIGAAGSTNLMTIYNVK